ncbi:hypothetical protein P7K49_012406, partial [Saguinus oedipus]
EKVVMLPTSTPIQCNRPVHGRVGSKAACDVSRLQDLLGQKGLVLQSNLLCLTFFCSSGEERPKRRGRE